MAILIRFPSGAYHALSEGKLNLLVFILLSQVCYIRGLAIFLGLKFSIMLLVVTFYFPVRFWPDPFGYPAPPSGTAF